MHCKKVLTIFFEFFSYIIEYDVFLITFGSAICSRMTLQILVRFQFFVPNERFHLRKDIPAPPSTQSAELPRIPWCMNTGWALVGARPLLLRGIRCSSRM